MNSIFIGLLLIFLDFNLTIETCVIGLIPDFIGYIVLIRGLKEMRAYSPQFEKAKPFATGMAVYTGILYLLDLVGMTNKLGYFSIPLGMVSVAVSLYITYLIVTGIQAIEADRSYFLNGAKLFHTWKLLAIFQVVTYVLLLIPALSILSILVSLVISIVFLVALNQSKNLFMTMPPVSAAQNQEYHE